MNYDKLRTELHTQLDGPNTILSTKELFALGNAFGSFSVGEIDQGIHLILPVRDMESGLMENLVFQELCDTFLFEDCTTGMDYIQMIQAWAKDKGVDI